MEATQAEKKRFPAQIYSKIGFSGLFNTPIGDSAFELCESLTSITIPDSVISIGDSAFKSCSSLTSITLPDSVTSIGAWAFSHCYSLTSITIPDSVTSIGFWAFSYCRSLTSITIPDSVTSMGNGVFYSCMSLTSITLPNSVTSIRPWDFSHCYSLTSITIPDSVTSIGDNAFESCKSLTSITIPDSVTSIGDNAFESCKSLTSITLPDSVTSIGDSAFELCYSLTSITIPDSVTSIGEEPFTLCENLESILVNLGNPNYTSLQGVLFNKDLDQLVTYPGGKAGEYTLPDSVTSIDDGAFYWCKSLTSLTIPDSVTSIGAWAFAWCESLTSITIPDSVTSIGDSAFYRCYRLKSVFIEGNAPTTWGDSIFGSVGYGFTIYFYPESTGFTEPNWNGYSAREWRPFLAPVLDIQAYYESSFSESIAINATPIEGFPYAYTYRWYHEDSAIWASNGSTYEIDGFTSEEGTWRVEVTNDAGTTSATFEYLIAADDDGDGLSNGFERYESLTNPNQSDTDGDGLNDSDELNVHGSDPLDIDSDNDTIADGIEVRHQTYGFDPAVDSTVELIAFREAAADLPTVMTEEQAGKLSLGGVALTPDGSKSFSLDFLVETSDDLENWDIVDSLSYHVDEAEGKMFMRVRKP